MNYNSAFHVLPQGNVGRKLEVCLSYLDAVDCRFSQLGAHVVRWEAHQQEMALCLYGHEQAAEFLHSSTRCCPPYHRFSYPSHRGQLGVGIKDLSRAKELLRIQVVGAAAALTLMVPQAVLVVPPQLVHVRPG